MKWGIVLGVFVGVLVLLPARSGGGWGNAPRSPLPQLEMPAIELGGRVDWGTLPEEVLARARSEVETALAHEGGGAHRNSLVRWFKRGGALSAAELCECCPTVASLYFTRVHVHGAVPSPDWDPHALAAYVYAERDDGVAWHRDRSFYAGRRYTVLLPLVDNSTMRLEVRDPALQFSGRLEPGVVLMFDDSVEHRVTPMLGDGERRIVLSFEYVTSRDIGWLNYLNYELRNSAAYFGFTFTARLALAITSALAVASLHFFMNLCDNWQRRSLP